MEGRASPGSMWRVERGNEAILGCLFHPYAQSKIGTWNKAILTVFVSCKCPPPNFYSYILFGWVLRVSAHSQLITPICKQYSLELTTVVIHFRVPF